MPRRYSAQELLLSTHCGTVERSPVTLLPSRVLAVWVISEFNLQTSLVTGSQQSGAVRKTRRLQRNSVPASTLIAKRPTRQRNCRNWAAHKSFWRQRQARKRCLH